MSFQGDKAKKTQVSWKDEECESPHLMTYIPVCVCVCFHVVDWLRQLFLHTVWPGEAPAGSRHNDVNDDN